jgi:signal transduction histidine kinase
MILKKSVKSVHLCESVIQTSCDIIKAHRGTISVESAEKVACPPARPGHSGGDDPNVRGTVFNINLPINQ